MSLVIVDSGPSASQIASVVPREVLLNEVQQPVAKGFISKAGLDCQVTRSLGQLAVGSLLVTSVDSLSPPPAGMERRTS